MMRRIAVAALITLCGADVRAQAVQGVVVDASDRPVSGVVMILLDSASRSVSRALSNERGEFRLSPPDAGTYRVRSTRIGFRPLVSEAMLLRTGEVTRPRLVISSFALALDTIRVQGHSSCSMSPRDSAAAAWRVWEQVRAALTAGQLTARARAVKVNLVSYERALAFDRRTILQQTAKVRSDLVRQPWREDPYDQIRARGYVDATGDSTVYIAPGLEALLNDGFLEDHCFRLTSKNPRTVEVEFEPTRDRKQVTEVRGSASVDRATSELRRLEFRYVHASREIEDNAGGDMDFVRLPTGAWMISRWNIRMPEIALFERAGYAPEPRLTGLKVTGGELLAAMVGPDTLWSRAPIVFTGTVVDSSSQRPVQAARVGLAGTDVSVFTDRRGEFSAKGVMAGSYVVEVSTASLDSIGAVKTLPLVITDSMPPVRIPVPTSLQMSEQVCGHRVRQGVILGTANLRTDTVSRAGIEVSANWIEKTVTRTALESTKRGIVAHTDPSGTFTLCDVPLGIPLTVRASFDSATAAREFQIPTNQRFARVDLALDRGLTPVAAFAGIVMVDSTRTPITNAQVAVAARLALTDAKGEFRILDIPVGRQHVSVRRLGYAPLDVDLDFVPDETLRRALALTPVTMLDSVLITARTRDQGMEDFEAHRKLALGHFITRGELEKNGGRQLSDLVRQTTAGLIPVRMFDGKAYIMNRRLGCYSAVYVDGLMMYQGDAEMGAMPTGPKFDINSLGLSAIEAVEMYTGAGQIPAQYMRLNSACGVVVIHTRRPDKPPL
jgi:hypothetical protein